MTHAPSAVDSRSPHRSPRRRFLAGLAASIAAPWFVPSTILGRGAVAPSERITIGSIGLGSRGNNHLDAFIGNPATRVVAACDPYRSKCQAAKAKADRRYGDPVEDGKGCFTTTDFRELLARDTIDAVVIASPENWHALQAAEAAKAGKDIYCEKALSLTVKEGRAACDAVRRYGRILQFGTQQRSDAKFRFACELARNGYLGKLQRVEVGVPGGRSLPTAPPKDPPADIDYEMWLGPAPTTPYNDLKCTFNWYFLSDYCVGWIQSWGVHHVDIALWGAPELATSDLNVTGTATFPTSGLADTSITWNVEARTPKGLVLSFSDNSRNPQGCRFVGEEGWVLVNRGGIRAEPASLLDVRLRPGDERLAESHDHHGNFLDSIRTRKDPVAPVEAGYRATALTIVSDLATRCGKTLTWNSPKEVLSLTDSAGEPLAGALERPLRAPWTL